jgi:hypothetical protein
LSCGGLVFTSKHSVGRVVERSWLVSLTKSHSWEDRGVAGSSLHAVSWTASSSLTPSTSMPSVLKHNLQCHMVRKMTAREECHWPHALQELQASSCGNSWHPRLQISVEKRAPYIGPPTPAQWRSPHPHNARLAFSRRGGSRTALGTASRRYPGEGESACAVSAWWAAIQP